MRRYGFYLRYALQNILRGGRWSSLAIFCIAAGVATVVALRGLGLSIAESLMADVRRDLKGDVRVVKDRNGGSDQILNLTADEALYFSDRELTAMRDYAAEFNGIMSTYTTAGNIQVIGVDGGGLFSTSQFIETFLIDPSNYPPTHTIRAIDPAGVPLEDLFTGGAELVISATMASNQYLSVGDKVRIARTETEFTVVGIVASSEEVSIRRLFAAFFGFAYMDIEAARTYIDPTIGVNNALFAFEPPLNAETVLPIQANLRNRAILSDPNVTVDSAIDQLERNQTISQVLGDFIVVMGLGAMLIGGVGIMNTMLVLVRRRTNEIAAMKTFGMKGRQVASLFLAEGLLLGIFGSAFGCVAGILLSGIVNDFGERFVLQELTWRIYPEALLYGMVLGLMTTIIFSLAPIMNALEIRPAIILRPNENHAPRLGILRIILLMIFTTIALGLIVGQIVRPTFGLVSVFNVSTPYLFGLIVVAFTLAVLGILTFLLWILVWFVGKLPSFGNVYLRLALRNLSSQRTRTATTLLALSAGMFALSSISFVGEGTRQLLNLELSRRFGGNILAFPLSGGANRLLLQLSERSILGAINDVEGVKSWSKLSSLRGELLSIDGISYAMSERALEGEDLDRPPTLAELAPYQWDNLMQWSSPTIDIHERVLTIVEGRNLSAADTGQLVIVAPQETAVHLGARVGSVVQYRLGRQSLSYTIVGFYSTGFEFGGGAPIVPLESTGGVLPRFQIFSFDVEDAHRSEVIAELSAVRLPPVIAVDVSFFDSLLSRLIEQFAALPTIVGVLSLFAAAVIMANTIALATLERRQQIGILKAIGLKSHRVLIVMLIESTIIGLLSSGLGIGLSLLGIYLAGEVTGAFIPLPRSSQLVAVGLVTASVVIAWTATFLSANVATRERVMNVLRYD